MSPKKPDLRVLEGGKAEGPAPLPNAFTASELEVGSARGTDGRAGVAFLLRGEHANLLIILDREGTTTIRDSLTKILGEMP